MNVAVCHHALVRCQVEGKLESMQQLANSCGRSRSTATRFFSGRTSLTSALAVLDALKLSFDDVFAPCTVSDHGCAQALASPANSAGLGSV
jgi:hypothetical protein